MDKPHAAVDSRLLPGVLKASDERAHIGVWCTTLFCTILSCNLLGLIPFSECSHFRLHASKGTDLDIVNSL